MLASLKCGRQLAVASSIDRQSQPRSSASRIEDIQPPARLEPSTIDSALRTYFAFPSVAAFVHAQVFIEKPRTNTPITGYVFLM